MLTHCITALNGLSWLKSVILYLLLQVMHLTHSFTTFLILLLSIRIEELLLITLPHHLNLIPRRHQTTIPLPQLLPPIMLRVNHNNTITTTIQRPPPISTHSCPSHHHHIPNTHRNTLSLLTPHTEHHRLATLITQLQTPSFDG